MHLIRHSLTLTLTIACATACLAESAPLTTKELVKKQVAVLESGATQKEKADACRELARIGTSDAVAPLAALLSDEQLSHMARYGLEPIPGSSVDKALRDAAGKLQGRLLAGVVGSIGVRRDPKAVKLLTKLLQAPDNDVAQAAARSLGSIGTPAAGKALLDALPAVSAANQLALCEGLLRCAETQAGKGNRKQAVAIYDRLRATAAPHQVRTAAVRGAILTRQTDGLPLLKATLRDSNFALFSAAVRSAQEMPGPEVTRLLAGELPTIPAERQILLMQTLAQRGDAAALPALFAAARSGDKSARLAAVRAIAQFGDASALPVFVELMDDPDKDIAAAAQESLGGLPGKDADAAIIKMLADGPAARRASALDLIARRRMTAAIPALFDAAGGPDLKLRVAATKRLGELAGSAEVPRLLDLLVRAASSEDLEAAEQALSAACLRAQDPASCVSQVEGRLTQAPPAQQCALVRVLGAVGGEKALKAVRGAVQHPNTEVRATAIRALGAWSTADAAPHLLEAAKAASNPTDKMICLRGYLRLAGQADLPVDKRLAMCREAAALTQKDEEKRLLLAALGGIASVEAFDLVAPHLDEPGTKEEAATAAVNVSDMLLKSADAAKLAPRLAEVLDKVCGSTANADLAKRAKELGDQAKTKVGGK
ncbi:MAG TPA: HEAT repeat domain-containing protein [Candidatus Paceibacterota bacterium]|nr:HEAT repeat domain-containing protein [Verrucomicrobiota bacterium]HSA10316.1 HEAT repeat domain-containing protein [Candidatus Paceibacterota bacterium]